MTELRRALALLAPLTLAPMGCARTAPPPTTVTAVAHDTAPERAVAPAAAARLTVSPLRFTERDVAALTLDAQGNVSLQGAPWARLSNDRLVALDGRVLAEVRDGRVRFDGADHEAALTDDGALSHDGESLRIDDAGTPVFQGPRGTVTHGALRIEGVTASTRATAAVLVGALMMRARAMRADAPESP